MIKRHFLFVVKFQQKEKVRVKGATRFSIHDKWDSTRFSDKDSMEIFNLWCSSTKRGGFHKIFKVVFILNVFTLIFKLFFTLNVFTLFFKLFFTLNVFTLIFKVVFTLGKLVDLFLLLSSAAFQFWDIIYFSSWTRMMTCNNLRLVDFKIRFNLI